MYPLDKLEEYISTLSGLFEILTTCPPVSIVYELGFIKDVL